MATDLTTLLGGGGGGAGVPWERLMKFRIEDASYYYSPVSSYVSYNQDFWDHFDDQNTYIYTTNISSWTTVVNVTGSGKFGGVIGTKGLGVDNFRITIDGEQKTFSINCPYARGAVVPWNIILNSSSDVWGNLIGIPRNNNSAPATDITYLPITESTNNPFTIPYRESLKVEIQSNSGRYNTWSNPYYAGVIHARD
jgi:hypothetical protein